MLLSMIRPLCKWHLVMAVTLLELALIYTSINGGGGQQGLQERRLQQVLAQTRELAGALKETRTELKALLKAEKQRELTLKLLDSGFVDMERQIASLKAITEAS